MIAPDMATMLSFVFTDAAIEAPVLQALLSRGVVDSFNAVTVDSDTSTSDTLLLFATGARSAARRASATPPIRASKPSARRSTAFFSTSPTRWRATARAPANSSRSTVDGAVSKRSAAPDRPVDRQFAAGQDGDRRRGRQLGPRRHGGRQGRRAGRARPARDLVRRHRVAVAGARDPAYDEAAVSAYMKGQDISSGSISGSAEVAIASTPAI